MSRRHPTAATPLSTVAMVSAAVVFAVSVWNAVRIAPVIPDAPAEDRAAALAGGLRDVQRIPDDDSMAALSRDPFSLDASAPDEGLAHGGAPDTATASIGGAIRLLGTVVRESGGFAVCQLANDAPRIVHIGDRVGGLVLISLEQGRVLFRTQNGTRLELSLSTPGT